MATELGQAYVQIMPSAKGIKGSIEKELGGEATSAGKSAGSSIATAIKGAITVAAIGKFIGSALTAGGDLQQSLGGVETLFKENADKVKAYANEAYETVGVSANDYMENVTSFSASLLQSLGGDTEKAAEKANTAMIDMGDNANKMGTDMQSIQNAYQGFAKENYTMLDNLKLGYGGTKKEMERLLADAEKLTGVKYDINNLADVYDAIHAVQVELGITGTTALEATETLSGSLAAMKSAFSNFLGNLALGQDIGPSLQALAETVSTFLFGNFLPMVGNILKALPGAIITFVQSATPLFLDAGTGFISELVTGITTGLPNFLESLSTMATNGMETITKNLPMFLEKGKEIITNLVNGILEAIPSIIESAGNIINTFVGFFMENYPKILETGKELLVNIVKGIIDNLPQIIESAIKIIGNLIDTIIKNLPKIIATGVRLLVELVGGIISSLPKLVEAAVTLIAKFVGMIISKLPDIIGAGVKILTSIVSGIGQVASQLYDKGRELMQGLTDKINEWKSKFKEAGSNIVSSIADGIKGAIGKVKDAIGTVTEKIRGYLPFSPAKEGPLKDLNKLNFGDVISQSILNAKRPVTKAMDELASLMMSDYDVENSLDMSMTSTKSGFINMINHTGVITVEGVNDNNELMAVVDIVMDELRREVRA